MRSWRAALSINVLDVPDAKARSCPHLTRMLHSTPLTWTPTDLTYSACVSDELLRPAMCLPETLQKPLWPLKDVRQFSSHEEILNKLFSVLTWTRLWVLVPWIWNLESSDSFNYNDHIASVSWDLKSYRRWKLCLCMTLLFFFFLFLSQAEGALWSVIIL